MISITGNLADFDTDVLEILAQLDRYEVLDDIEEVLTEIDRRKCNFYEELKNRLNGKM